VTRSVVSSLSLKLLRDLWHLRGQAVTIALVVASGLATFVTLRGAYGSLEHARASYYREQRFADLFVHLERAPEALALRLERLPFVSRVQTRIVSRAMVPLDSVAEPIRAQVVSLPRPGEVELNRVELVEGRLVTGDRADEALLLESFAVANGIRVEDRLPAVLNGKKRMLRVVGIARSPEHVFAQALGEPAPDPARFAVLFLSRPALEATFRMEGAFNDVSLTFDGHGSEGAVVDAVDRLLEPYGGMGATLRARQPSNYAITGELEQLRGMSTVLPLIFVLVAALLVNVVMSRLVHLQRPEIATLKALGYSNLAVGAHYLQLVLAVVSLGTALGVGAGAVLGAKLLTIYARFFKFPALPFRFDLGAILMTVAFCFVCAVAGALSAVRAATQMPPAEAMRPLAPTHYRRSFIDHMGLTGWFGPASQMVFRELGRRPLRVLTSAVAIAASVGLMVTGGWYYDALGDLIFTQFHLAMREDMSVSFSEARPARAVRELAHLPGVLQAEGLRALPVRFRVGHRARDGVILGYPRDAELRTLRDKFAQPAAIPPDGIDLTDMLATLLEIEPGDRVRIEVHEGQRLARSLTVTGLVSESFGLQGHMDLDAMHRWLGEQDRRSVALLRVDPLLGPLLDQRLKDLPFVASVTRRSEIIERFRAQSGSMIVTVSMIIILFAATITVGVVYNNARVALSTRARDLSSLRVLGFTRREISAVLLAEMSVPVILAILPGLALGHWFVELLSSTVDPETYRLPILISPRSYGLAALVALAASAWSALLVRRRLDRLDLIGVLKTRE